MQVLVKIPKGEMDLEYLCEMEYKRINGILTKIEEEFNTDMNNHPELRHFILDTAAFIKRLPQTITECGGGKVEST
jgi:hypothetical protein